MATCACRSIGTAAYDGYSSRRTCTGRTTRRWSEETNSNYGGLFSCWDRLFGTYVDEPGAGHEGMAIGLPEFQEPRHIRLGWMLANPLLGPSRTERGQRGSRGADALIHAAGAP